MKETMKKLGLEPRVIGRIGVDAGVVWIGDPCYILHHDPPYKDIGRDWPEFCDKLGGIQHRSFNFDMGHEGLGVCTSTRWGDGFYPVIGLFEPGSDRPSAVIVDFEGKIEREITNE